MNTTFRKATAEDITAIENLFIEMLKSIYPTEEVKGYEEDYLNKFFGTCEDCIFVAENNYTVIGYISVEVKREDNYIYIDDFCVSEKYRHKGIGKKLLELAETFAKEKGIFDILLHVEESNTIARSLYEKCGYKTLKTEGNRILLKKSRR